MKTIYTLMFCALFSATLFGQKDFREAYEEVKQYEFEQYTDIYFSEGKRVISGMYYTAELKPELNQFGNLNGVHSVSKESDKVELKYNLVYDFYDHYTKPAYLRNEDSKRAILFIDSVLFELKDVADDFSAFTIDAIWIPIVTASKESEDENSKKKISLKEKMAEVKRAFNGNPLKPALETQDLNEKINNYVVSMKKIQANTTYTAKEREEIEALRFSSDSTKMVWKGKNDAYWMSEEGQRSRAEMRAKQGLPTNWFIKNSTGKTIEITTYGNHTTLNNGGTLKVWCSDDAYYGINDNGQWKNGAIIGKGADQCGKTIELK